MNRRDRRAQAAQARKGRSLSEAMFGVLEGKPEMLRYTNICRALRRAGADEAVLQLIEEKEKYGSRCPTHGELKDPVIAYVDSSEGKRVAFGCPMCSGPTIQAQWEREGGLS